MLDLMVALDGAAGVGFNRARARAPHRNARGSRGRPRAPFVVGQVTARAVHDHPTALEDVRSLNQGQRTARVLFDQQDGHAHGVDLLDRVEGGIRFKNLMTVHLNIIVRTRFVNEAFTMFGLRLFGD
jgi:hypothetical protein